MGVLENFVIFGLVSGASYAAYLYDRRRANGIDRRIEDMTAHTNRLVLERNFTSRWEAEKYVKSAYSFISEKIESFRENPIALFPVRGDLSKKLESASEYCAEITQNYSR